MRKSQYLTDYGAPMLFVGLIYAHYAHRMFRIFVAAAEFSASQALALLISMPR
jgi:hypothetical protein